MGVINLSISKNESKSQRLGFCKETNCGVINLSISKNESKSQRRNMTNIITIRCYKSQYFKE